MPHILFVCTGNVFRSLTADLALKSVLPPDCGWTVASAGTQAKSDKALRDDVRERLVHWGADPSAHKPRRLTQEIVDSADLVVAMSGDHQKFIAENFGRRAVLYMEIATGNPADFLDLDDVVKDFYKNKDASRAYINQAIDLIFTAREAFLQRLPLYLKPEQNGPAPRTPAPF